MDSDCAEGFILAVALVPRTAKQALGVLLFSTEDSTTEAWIMKENEKAGLCLRVP